jgi:hypothetical protein
LGSAREAFTALRAAEAWGYVGAVPEGTVNDFNQVIGTLVKVTRGR